MTTADVSSPAVQSSPDGTGIEANGQARAGAQWRAQAREGTRTGYRIAMIQVRRYTGGGVFDSTPATLAQVVRYTNAGGWIPGERAQWLENIGRAYGYLIAVPATLICFLALWTVQRPTRVVGAGLLALALRWAL